ncbi:unannotated protein [freshwater metagenome]|uniref:Unannotated protein n=1 Tax=freshwater metagenome TaxID=449393 RepID=A0A6J6I5D3_9ZZZZ|nr:thiolase family protein [Actinomycetota bacterium]
MSLSAAITGMGVVICGPKEIPDATGNTLSAISMAAQEAGIDLREIDGLLINQNELIADDHLTLDLSRRGAFGTLKVLYELESKGTTMSVLLKQATEIVNAGEADNVVVVFADAAISPNAPSGAAFASMGGDTGYRGLERAGGMLGAVAAYALIAQHYFVERNADIDDLFAVAQAQRSWAVENPLAWIREPLTREKYDAAPLVAAPLRRLDCARPVSGAAAFIVSKPNSSNSLNPVYVRGMAQRHTMRRRHAPHSPWRPVGASEVFTDALKQARTTADAIDNLQIYDAFTIVPLVMMEELGVVGPGEAGSFIAAGNTRHGGSLPVNTGGGQISGFYLQGATPLIEAVTQLRGQGGNRQIADASTSMVVSVGGRLESVNALVMGVQQ